MTIEAYRIPVISTCHLNADVAKVLSEKRNDNPWVPCAEWEHGFFVCLERLHGKQQAIPKCLLDVRQWLVKQGFEGCWVRFDADGPVVDELPDCGVMEHCEAPATEERDPWGSNPDYPVEDWQYQVTNGDTRRGYWDWVDAEIAANRQGPSLI